MEGFHSGLLQLYSEVESKNLEWLWYPYIPSGKITILQGDPGCGKSTLILNLIASLTTGRRLPGMEEAGEPVNVIYQCSEDSVADTIKPRLIKAGADCSRVAFIKEEDSALSLEDDRIRAAIVEFGAKMIVIDPVQAYLGDADLSNANSIRKIMRRLSMVAEAYQCAVVLVGHLNKKEGSKDLYRSLGSIDIMAAARSVLQVEYDQEGDGIRTLRQVKNSLAAVGGDISFQIASDGELLWEDAETSRDSEAMTEIESSEQQENNGNTEIVAEGEVTTDTEHAGSLHPTEEELRRGEPILIKDEHLPAKSKQELAAVYLREILQDGPENPNSIYESFKEFGVSKRTVTIVKKILGVQSVRKDGQWYWILPSMGGETDAEEQREDFNQNPQGCP